MPAFNIGRRVFRTKGAAQTAVRAVLNTGPVDRILDAVEFSLIRDLLDLHYQRDEKLAGGCVAIVIRTNKVPNQPPQRGFYVVHDDGSETEFSIYVPFATPAQLRRYALLDVRDACRRAISDQVAEFKRLAFSSQPVVVCAATGVVLSWDDAVVDHYGEWPFSRIVDVWLEDRDYPELIDRKIFKELLVDDGTDFVRFHNEKARLRIIHRRENSRVGARG